MQIFREEMARLKASQSDLLDSAQVRAAKRLLARDAGELPAQDRAVLDTVLSRSSRLATVYRMRSELAALWARSTASREQLLRQLQDWCARAEASGIAQLQEMSLRLRRYAI